MSPMLLLVLGVNPPPFLVLGKRAGNVSVALRGVRRFGNGRREEEGRAHCRKFGTAAHTERQCGEARPRTPRASIGSLSFLPGNVHRHAPRAHATTALLRATRPFRAMKSQSKALGRVCPHAMLRATGRLSTPSAPAASDCSPASVDAARRAKANARPHHPRRPEVRCRGVGACSWAACPQRTMSITDPSRDKEKILCRTVVR